MKSTIKDIVKGTKASFVYYRQKMMYYKVYLKRDRNWYIFPVPIDDLMEASCNDVERTITLMRYVRKSVANGSFVRYYE